MLSGARARALTAGFSQGVFSPKLERMLATASDIGKGCAVLIMIPPCGDEGWRAYIRAIDELQAATSRVVRPALIQVLRHGIDVPSPVVRRELATLRKRIRPDVVNAVVVEDATVRLVQTALDWIYRPHYVSSSHASFAAALAQVERSLGRPLPAMEWLYQEAAGKLNTTAT